MDFLEIYCCQGSLVVQPISRSLALISHLLEEQRAVPLESVCKSLEEGLFRIVGDFMSLE